ncbi:MAG: 2-hydroxyacid dehydrogenase [Vulcanimicrobiaceae bacterium]
MERVVAAVNLFDDGFRRLGAGAAYTDVSAGIASVAASPAERAALTERVRTALPGALGLICAPNFRVDADVLDAGPQLRVVSTASVGFEHIDVAACSRRGIAVGNTPGVVVEATADIAWILTLMLFREIPAAIDHVRNGGWGRGQALPLAHDPQGKTLGIVGLGAVGAAVAHRACASGMRLIYNNRTPRPDAGQFGAEHRSFEALLAQSDAIVVAAPLTAQTRGLFDARAFAQMKPTAFLVNVARGGVVVTDDLVEALRAGRIAGAGLDVFEPEPIDSAHPLLGLPNVIAVPHVGTASVETRLAMVALAVDNVLAGIAGRPPPACVNPEIFAGR